jgi:uncharacterized protein YwgA
MDRQQIGVKLTIDGLGLSFGVNTFEDRLIMQKAVYLAQTAGVNLGYYYHWYLYGPYSPSLTRDGFAIAMDISAGLDESKGWRLDDESSKRIERIRCLFGEKCSSKLAGKLELLASVHFLLDRKQASRVDPSGITATLKRFNKTFEKEDVEDALEELKSYDLLEA